MNQNFDILDYLNDLYMAKITPDINIKHAGGHYNIHNKEDDKVIEDDDEENLVKNNKKRIHIPNAEIKHFSLGVEESIEEHNEPGTEPSTDSGDEQDGTGNNVVSDETREKGSHSGGVTDEVVEI